MPDRDPPLPSVPESRSVPKKRTRLSLVWFIPIVAAMVGAWVAVTQGLERGAQDHDRLAIGRGTGGRQDQDPLQRRRHRHRHGDPAVGGSPARDHHRADGAQDGRLSGRRHEVLGRAAADIGRQRDGAGHSHLRGLHRRGDRHFEGDQARLRGAGDAAGDNRRNSRPLFHPEDTRPGFAGHRHADLLPAAAGRPGRVIRARQGRQESDRQGVRASARTTSTSTRTPASGMPAESTCRSRRAVSPCRPSRFCRS